MYTGFTTSGNIKKRGPWYYNGFSKWVNYSMFSDSYDRYIPAESTMIYELIPYLEKTIKLWLISQKEALRLRTNSDIFIITNSIKMTNLFINKNRSNIFCIGGALNQECYGFTGQYANQLISSINARYETVGVHGIDLEKGLTLAISGETQYVSELLKNVKEKIILADHTKFGRSSLYKIDVQLEDIDKIITDEKTDREYIIGLEKMGIKVLIADTGN